MKSLCCIRKIGFFTPLMAFAVSCFIPLYGHCTGFQEQKLFNADFYSSEDLNKNMALYTRQIKVIDSQVKALRSDIDWLVLKIDRIEDSGRNAPSSLKQSISVKEKKIASLMRTRNRLDRLVSFYSGKLEHRTKKQPAPAISVQTLSQPARKITPAPVAAPAPPVPEDKAAGVEASSFSRLSREELQKAIDRSGLGEWLEISGSGTCLRIQTTLPILFPTGSARLAGEYKSFFKKLAKFLQSYDVRVLVNGYADKVPIKNRKYRSNFELGAARAANIVHQLVRYGLKPSIFRIESTGRYRFAAKGMSAQKSFERRAEVTIIFAG